MSSGGVQLPEAKSAGAAGRWGRIHLGIVAAGALLLALMANYDALWFDEAYSVGMAAHSFEEMWTIGAADVHPVLYYWVLHCVYLVFGQNIVAYRLVSVAGVVALAMLGYTHVRKDFGPRCGMIFTLLVFLVPWAVRVALQIRMYSWLALAVMVAAIYGWRIVSRLRDGGCSDANSADPVPLGWWAAMAVASLAAAYLHYYGAMAAFCVQAMVLLAVARTASGRLRNIACWGGFAAVAVAAFLPWLSVAASQAGAVSGGFWITLGYPDAVSEIALFPFNAPEATGFMGRQFAGLDTSCLGVALFLVLLAVEAACIFSFGRALGGDANERSDSPAARYRGVVCFMLGVYLGTIALAWLASLVLGQAILYFRYLAAALGPVLLSMALVLSCLVDRRLKVASWALVAVFALITYGSIAITAYSPENAAPLRAYGQLCEEVTAESGGEAPLVFSDSEATASIVAESGEGLPIVYLDPAYKYKAFEPRFVVDPLWEQLLQGYQGRAIFIGAEETAAAFAERFGGEVVSSEGLFHPYSSNWLIYSVIAF